MTAPVPIRRKWRKRLLRGLLVLVALFAIVALLFVGNGTILADGETARVGHYESVELASTSSGSGEITIASYNVAKGWAPRGGVSFNDSATVERRVHQMADAIRAEKVDVLFLSEIMTECTPCPVDQVAFLARELGLPYWAFGGNYNFGLPFYRVVGGNAILSRFPLAPVANPALVGHKPFYETKNSRRALFASVEIDGKSVLLGSLHNDSYDIHNNEAQVRQLLEFIGERPCVLAGDFNAKPHQPPIRLIRESGKFDGAFDGPPSFPADKPEERIDYVFAPIGWAHVETRVIVAEPSDHRPVVARFKLPR